VLSLYYYKETIEYGANEPQIYAEKPVVLYLPATATLAPIFSDQDLVVPIPNSRITTNEFGELSFFCDQASLDCERLVGGRRTLLVGDPGGADEFVFTRSMFFS